MFDPMELGRELKHARIKRGVTQRELARRVQLSTIFIAKIEAGERMPSWETLERMSQALKVIVRVALIRDRQKR